MATQIADAILHIDESLENWQRDVLNDHMRLQDGVISSGQNDNNPHLMIVQYDPGCTDPLNFIHMIQRHGYHAARVG
ncbi:MAG: ATP-binding protein [Gammaproteobacteria bacterium]|nr:ATP-binding protein [Gammaproteobacteria bacterium]